jgi:hypothetical protein
MTKPHPTPTPTPEPKTRTTSTGVIAGRAYERLRRLHADQEAEITRSPEEIRAKYRKKMDALLEGLAPDVRELVKRMATPAKAVDSAGE